ncbi:MAG: hypothetical protein R3320_14505 [Nitriliruptorales bacterium]|nr:hypothetical protein [Nitriliruptorales bacterium]
MTKTTPEKSRPDLAETDVRIPETVPEFLEATRAPTRPRWPMMAVWVVALALVAAAALSVIRPWGGSSDALQYTPGTWSGDWKDVVISDTTPYTGDWKDALISDTTTPYTGDWKDAFLK